MTGRDTGKIDDISNFLLNETLPLSKNQSKRNKATKNVIGKLKINTPKLPHFSSSLGEAKAS